jgi:hypothetical protein
VAVRPDEVTQRRHILAASNDVAVEAFVKLALATIDQLHVRLEKCTPEEMHVLQGEIRAYKTVVKWAREPILQTVDK